MFVNVFSVFSSLNYKKLIKNSKIVAYFTFFSENFEKINDFLAEKLLTECQKIFHP